ncbi:MAG: acyl-CoA dehydrogenase [bacterium]|nr:acyl-CoA dehydrogenase [Deltaproteobacteria bacterium]MCP4907759.1 acyl-CoA dehydrogenase [bacterium]
MDLRYTAEEQEFRKELAGWLAAEVPTYGSPPPIHDWDARRAYDAGWQKRLFDAGYAGINWPKEYGGRDASLVEQLIYFEEIAKANAPYVGVNFVGLLHGGPTIMAEGTEAQKAAHIPRIISGQEIWCQGFSEPVAGSDLAGLQTKAERDGDHYLVSGHKIWTSFAQVADYCELLVRTDPDASKHGGISWLIMPMHLDGIDIRPLPTLEGEGEFSEVFLENVRIPVANLVGAENDGWRVTNVTLRFERGTAFASDMIQLQAFLQEMIQTAKKITRHGATAWDDKALRSEIGHLSGELESLWAMVKLSVCEAKESGVPGVGASAVKLYYTDIFQRTTELAVRLLGRAGLSRSEIGELPSDLFLERHFNAIKVAIAAGSTQIQKNIIGERILGLPKEPKPNAP